ncbi:MAG: GDP-mannose 4,6-dehydratase, partial [Nodosilinea sp.]
FSYLGLDYQKYVSVDPEFYRPDEEVQLVGAIDKIKAELNWQPKYSFQKLVESMVDYDFKVLSASSVS